MRIAFAHYGARFDISGVTTWLKDLAPWLCQQGLQVAVHLHHFGKDIAEASIADPLRQAGVQVGIAPRGPDLKADVRTTLAFLDDFKPDVFLPQCLHAHFFSAAIAGRRGLPWALTMHSDDPDYWAFADAQPPWKHGGHVVCVSRYLAAQVRSRGGLAPFVIPCGVSIPQCVTEFRREPFRVVYSGRLVELQKRASLVVESLIRACHASPRVIATVIGDGQARRECEKAVQNAGLSNRIRFAGRLPAEQVGPILLDSQAILLMSDFEGLPVALMEAMAAGVVPVARSITSGVPELVHHESTGLLVSEDPEEAAAAIVRLSESPALWQRCSENSRQLVAADFCREGCREQWLQLIAMLAKTSQPQYPMGIKGRLRLEVSDSRFAGDYYHPPSALARLGRRARAAAGRVWRSLPRCGDRETRLSRR